jgi:hypothetical protein
VKLKIPNAIAFGILEYQKVFAPDKLTIAAVASV